MLLFIFAFIIAFGCCWLILKTQLWHNKYSTDADFHSAQKFHHQPTPRIGGLAIFISAWVLAIYGLSQHQLWAIFFIKLLAPSSLIFAIGFTEDLCKQLSPLLRLALIFLTCLMGIYLVHIVNLITHTNVQLIDYLLRFAPISIIITIFILLGATNAFNLIDGYNGLCLTTFSSILLASLYIAYQVNYHYLDPAIFILLGGAVGVALWNYPRGKIFLGDGGAYLLGFTATLILLELSQQLPNYSPFTSLLLMIYPISETILSIYRKKFLRKRSPFLPDRLHMHMVIYYRLIKHDVKNRNAAVLIKMLWFILPQLFIASLFYSSQIIIIASILIYLISYFYLYFRIVSYHTPRYLRPSFKIHLKP